MTGSTYHFSLQQGEDVRESQTFTLLKEGSASTTTTPNGPSSTSSANPVVTTTTSQASNPFPSASDRVIAYGYPPKISAYDSSAVSFTSSEIVYKLVLPSFTFFVALGVLIWHLIRRRSRRRRLREQRRLEGKPEPPHRGSAFVRLFSCGRKRKHDDDESRAEEAGGESHPETETANPSSPSAIALQQEELRELDGREIKCPPPAASAGGARSPTKAAPKPLVKLVYEKDGRQLKRIVELGSGKLRSERKSSKADEKEEWLRKYSSSTSGSVTKEKELV